MDRVIYFRNDQEGWTRLEDIEVGLVAREKIKSKETKQTLYKDETERKQEEPKE